MDIFRQKQLYRIITTEQIKYKTDLGVNFDRNDNFMGYHKFGYIPKGITGWVVRWLGKDWFAPDSDQEGLEYFERTNLRSEGVNELIPLKKLNGCYIEQS